MFTPGIVINKPEDSISKELLISKFKSLGKDLFQISYTGEEDYLTYIKRGSQLTGFQLPVDKIELFINHETASYYWLCDTPALLKAEEWLRNESRNKSALLEDYRTIKEFYNKWALLKTDQEKRYFALSISKLAEKDTLKNNFLKQILYSAVLSFDNKMFASEKALELNTSAASAIKQSSLEEPVKNELLYVLRIFAGLVYLKQRIYDQAAICFSEAGNIKPTGITARYYNAYAEKMQGNRELCLLILAEIPDYDKELMDFAVNSNNLPFLYYILKNAFTYHILREMEFADLFDDIQAMILEKVDVNKTDVEKIGELLGNMNELHLHEFYCDELKQSVSFLEKLLQNFSGNANHLLNLCYTPLRQKYEQIADLLLKAIENRSNQEIFEKLSRYDDGINDNLEAVKHLTVELEELKKHLKKKLEDAIQYIEKSIKDNIAVLERRIENIHNEKKFNPRSTFNSLMLYNFIITLIVFVIGGFSGCYRGSIDNVYDFRDVMSTVVLSGVKWSAITFLLGMIIAFLASGFAVVEKMNEKSNLSRRIDLLRSQLDREIETLRRENDKKMISLSENFHDRIEEHKKNVDSLRKEKEENYSQLQAKAKEHIEKNRTAIYTALLLS